MFPGEGYNTGMNPNIPTAITQHPEFSEFVRALRGELDLGDHYLAGMALVIFEIDDSLPVPPRDEMVMRDRLMRRALMATERTIRIDPEEKRKIGDFVLRLDRYLFISLGSVDENTVKIPIMRIANQVRNEFYSTGDIHRLRLRRHVNIGVGLWDPSTGFLGAEGMVERAWSAVEACQQDKGVSDPYSYLGMAPSSLDTMKIALVGGKGATMVTPAAPAPPPKPTMAPRSVNEHVAKPATKPMEPTKPGVPARPAAPARPAVVTKKADEPKQEKKGWQFWK